MGDNRQDMIGFKSGKLLVVAYAATMGKRAMWLCRCECGNTKIVMGKYLRKKEVKSCGCLNRQPLLLQDKITHGHTINGKWSLSYVTWASMIQRCNNPKNSTYYKYGAKGITVCKEWLKFENFLKDMGDRPEDKTIDRIDNSIGYFTENCRWATPKEQAQNTTRNRNITFNKETHCLAEWGRLVGIQPSVIHSRLARG